MHVRPRLAGLIAVIGGGVLAVGAPAQAAMATDYPVTFTMHDPTSVSTEYGSYWNFTFTSDPGPFFALPCTFAAVGTGTPAGYKPFTYKAYNATADYIFSPSTEAPPLAAGAYTFTISVESGDVGDTCTANTPVPAKLTVTPAALGIDVRMIADASNGQNATVTASFTGTFAQNYWYSPGDPTMAPGPTGSWNFEIKDASGEVVAQQSVERTASSTSLAATFYWTEATPGDEYTATATFTPSGAAATNFSFAPSASFSYTSPDAVREIPTSTATAQPTADLPDEPDFSLPVLVPILIILVSAGLAALVIIQVVRLRRPDGANAPAMTPSEATDAKP